MELNFEDELKMREVKLPDLCMLLLHSALHDGGSRLLQLSMMGNVGPRVQYGKSLRIMAFNPMPN